MNRDLYAEDPPSEEDPPNDHVVAARDQDEAAPAQHTPTRRYPDDVSEDDRDTGWGERPAGSGRGDDWYLRERPPHHG